MSDVIRRGNFSGDPEPDTGDVLEFHNCNFSQPSPRGVGGKMRGVILWPNDQRPRTFVNCNMTNCEPPPGSTCLDCNTSIVESARLIDTDEVVIDGQSIEASNLGIAVHGRYLPDAETYEDKDPPDILPIDELIED